MSNEESYLTDICAETERLNKRYDFTMFSNETPLYMGSALFEFSADYILGDMKRQGWIRPIERNKLERKLKKRGWELQWVSFSFRTGGPGVRHTIDFLLDNGYLVEHQSKYWSYLLVTEKLLVGKKIPIRPAHYEAPNSIYY